MLDKHERIEMLRDAQKLLYDVTQLIADAVDDTPLERSADAYIIPHLQSWIEDPYQSANLEELIQALENDAAEEDL